MAKRSYSPHGSSRPAARGAYGRSPTDEINQALKRLRRSTAPRRTSTLQALRRTTATYLTSAPGIYGGATVFHSAEQLGSHHRDGAKGITCSAFAGIDPDAKTLEAALEISDELDHVIATMTTRRPKKRTAVRLQSVPSGPRARAGDVRRGFRRFRGRRRVRMAESGAASSRSQPSSTGARGGDRLLGASLLRRRRARRAAPARAAERRGRRRFSERTFDRSAEKRRRCRGMAKVDCIKYLIELLGIIDVFGWTMQENSGTYATWEPDKGSRPAHAAEDRGSRRRTRAPVHRCSRTSRQPGIRR